MLKLKNYVGGKFVEPDAVGYLDVCNPSTGEKLCQVPLSSKKEVEKAIDVAHKAFKTWSQTPVQRRVLPLFKLAQLLIEHESALIEAIVKENGKSWTDAKAEIKRVEENVETAVGMPILQQGDKLIGSSFDIDGEVIKLPIGVFGLICPFNFPAMVPFWFVPYAIATGNTIIVKASKQVPITLYKMAELIDKCGFPEGVFNVVNGDKEVADALLESKIVKGVSIVGSSSTCKVIAEKCASTNKRFQAMGAAKNHLIVMPDAKVEHVIRNMITSCFGCAGQRCMASSVIVCVGQKKYDEVVAKFKDDAKNVIMANPLDPKYKENPMLLGPVISQKSLKFIHDMIEVGVKEGAKLVVDGRNAKVEGCEKGHFIGPTIFTDVKPGMKIHMTEIFGPVVCMMKVESLDEAIEIINNHTYGNGASIYTQNGYYARKFKLEVNCGMIGVNVGIPAPVAYLPFGGMKNSQWSAVKAQGKYIIDFYTEAKVITERYWKEE